MEAMKKALQKIKMKKMGIADYMDKDMQDMAIEEGEKGNEDASKETDLAPELKDDGEMEIEIEQEDGQEPEMSLEKKKPLSRQEMEMMVQDMGGDQGDAIDEESYLRDMYQEGDENKKGFMGAAAKKMKEKLQSLGKVKK